MVWPGQTKPQACSSDLFVYLKCYFRYIILKKINLLQDLKIQWSVVAMPQGLSSDPVQ